MNSFEPGAGTPDHVSVHSGEYLRDGGHQTGLSAMGMSFGMILKFAPGKVAEMIEIRAGFGRFMAIKPGNEKSSRPLNLFEADDLPCQGLWEKNSQNKKEYLLYFSRF